VDVVRACIAIAKYDTLTLIIYGQPARHFLDMHFTYNSKPPVRSRWRVVLRTQQFLEKATRRSVEA